MATADSERKSAVLFRFILLVLLIGQMFVYYDTAVKTIPHINVYLLINLVLILLTLVPGMVVARSLWGAVWIVGALMRWDWATRATNSDVYWATSQGVSFLLHGMNPYTHVPTLVYEHAAAVGVYPTYSYFPVSLFMEAPFYLLGNVRFALALADVATALLIYAFARRYLGRWQARSLAAFWLVFLPGFQVALRLSIVDFLLLFWIALAVYLYDRGWPVASAAAAAMAVCTKQYGLFFTLPWEVLLLRPVVSALIQRWRLGLRGRSLVTNIARRMWLPPVVCALVSVGIVAPFLLASPQAFYDATIAHHSGYSPSPKLGTPQWNESIAAQLVALDWLRVDQAKIIFIILIGVAMTILVAAACLTIRDLPSALRWSAVLTGVWFGLSGMEVQFFYWRLPLFLGMLAFVAAWALSSGPESDTPADRAIRSDTPMTAIR